MSDSKEGKMPMWWPKTPTNRYAAKRPYCNKHSRAMIDIGGEKKCPACVAEQKGAR